MKIEYDLPQFHRHLASRLLQQAPAADSSYIQAAVLLPIVLTSGHPHLVFTRRTMSVATHKGQISFPGGIMDPADRSADDTALREAFEEVGLASNNVDIMGYLNGLHTVTDFWITPVVGMIKFRFRYVPAEAEVAEVIEVPFHHLLTETNWEKGEREYNGVTFSDCRLHFGKHVIWGATGKLAFALKEKIG